MRSAATFAVVLLCTSHAQAGEAVRLCDAAMDMVTAAARTGLAVGAGASSGDASALSIAGLVNASGLVGAQAVAVSPDGAGAARIGGPVVAFLGPGLSLSAAVLGSREATVGNGSAVVDAAVVAEGDITVSAAPFVRAPIGGARFGVAIAVAVDNPIGNGLR
jgi:hypothetical protein